LNEKVGRGSVKINNCANDPGTGGGAAHDLLRGERRPEKSKEVRELPKKGQIVIP